MAKAPTLDDPHYFDRLAEVERRHWWSRAMWRLASGWLDAALRGRSGLLAADVGCGTGLTPARLAARRELALVVGVEPSAPALRYARSRHPGPLVRGSALSLPFAASSLDLITALDVLQHTDDRRALAEFHRVLAPGGLVLVRVNGRGWSGDATTYTRARLTRRLEGAGFAVRRVSHANAVGSFVQELRGRLVRGRASHPSGGGLAITVPPRWINRTMGALATAEATLVGRAGCSLPFGHSTLALAEKPAG